MRMPFRSNVCRLHTAVVLLSLTLLCRPVVVEGTPNPDFATTNDFLAQVTVNALEDTLLLDIPTAPASVQNTVVPGEGGATLGTVVTSGALGLRNVSCSSFVITGGVTLSSAKAGSTVDIDLGFQSVELACAGLVFWTSSLDLSGPESFAPSEEAFATVVGQGAADVTLRVLINAGKPQFDSTVACSASVSSSNSSFPTSAPSRAINVASVVVPFLLEDPTLCSMLTDVSSNGLRLRLDEFNTFFDDTVASPAPDVDASESLLLQSLTAQEEADAIKFDESGLAQVLIQAANQVLGNPSNSSTSNELVINDVLRNLTDPEGEFRVELGSVSSEAQDLNLTFAGLTTFTAFDILNATSSYTVESDIALADSEVRIAVRRELVPTGSFLNGTVQVGKALVMSNEVSFKLGDNTAQIITALAVNPEEIKDVTIGALSENPLPCGAPLAYGVNLSSVDIVVNESAVRIELLSVEDAGWQNLVPAFNKLIEETYTAYIVGNLRAFTQGSLPFLTEEFNEFIQEKQVEPCPTFIPDPGRDTELLDFSNQPILDNILDDLSDVNNPDTGINRIMEEISEASNNQPGVFLLEPDLIDLEVDGAGDVLRINFTRIELSFLNTFERFAVLQSVGGSNTKTSNSVRLTSLKIVVQLEMRTLLGAGSALGDVEYFDTLELVLNEVDHVAEIDLKVLVNNILTLTLDQARKECIFSILRPDDGVRYDSFALTTSQTATFDCNGCGYTPTQEQEAADEIVKQIEIIDAFLGAEIRNDNSTEIINRELQELGAECLGTAPAPSAGPTLPVDLEIGVLITTSGAAAVLGMAAMLMGMVAFKRHATSNESLNSASPIWVRLLVPFLCLAALASFVAGNLYEITTLVIKLKSRSGPTNTDAEIDTIYSLSTLSGVRDLLIEGNAFLAIGFAFFNAALPILRVLSDLYLFYTPCISQETRINAIGFNQFAGKWILVTQTLVSTLVAGFFLDQAITSSSSLLSFIDFQLTVALVPGQSLAASFVGFLCATVVGHLLVMIHHAVLLKQKDVVAQSASLQDRIQDNRFLSRRTALSKQVMVSRQEDVNMQYKLTQAGRLLLTGLAFLGFGGAIAVAAVPVIGFEAGGLGGFGLQALQNDVLQSYSVAQLVFQLGSGSGRSVLESMYAAIAQGVLIVTLIVIPVVAPVLGGVILLLPMTVKEQRTLTYLLQQLRWWFGLDVLAVGILVASVNIKLFPALALREVCRDINTFIDDFLAPFGLLKPGEEVCFTSNANLDFGFYLLILVALISVLSVELIYSFALAALEDRDQAMENYKIGTEEEQAFMPTHRNLGLWTFMMKRSIGCLQKCRLVKANARGRGRRRRRRKNPVRVLENTPPNQESIQQLGYELPQSSYNHPPPGLHPVRMPTGPPPEGRHGAPPLPPPGTERRRPPSF